MGVSAQPIIGETERDIIHCPSVEQTLSDGLGSHYCLFKTTIHYNLADNLWRNI